MARSWTPLPLSLYFLLVSIWSSLGVAKSAAEYYIQSLPGQPDGPLLRMHAGHIEVTPEHHGNLFFWNFENKHLANRHRTVIWLNGGPGCSSLDGALMEIGPYRLKDDAHLEYNPGSWDEFANLLFVDNPVGTGFSYVDGDSYLHELTEMSSQFITFLDRYFALFPDQESNDLYFAGESYAGQHIPYIAKAIMDRNKSPPNGRKWNLKGLLIGNGWIAPEEQYMAYIPQAYNDGLVKKDSELAKKLEAQQTKCKAELDSDGADVKVNYPNCEKILHDILRLTSEERGNCVNMYDTRLDDEYPSCGMNWPPDLKFITPYLRRPDVIKALHIDQGKKSGWTECNGAVGGAFKARHSAPAVKLLPEILKEVPTLLFSGDQDLICSHIGTEAFIHNMEWNGGKGFELSPGTWAPRMDWTFEGEPAGYYQEARNLSYVLFYNASHMVPFDFPRRTRDMLDRFMGVDIANVGGEPADSRINGEKVPETSVGGHPNSTQAEQQVEEKIDKEKWAAYYRSGSIALVIIAILAIAFGWYVWQDRRRRRGYRGLAGNESSRGLMSQSPMPGDLEASAFDIDNNELDSLRGVRPGEPRYSLGGESSDEEDDSFNRKGINGHAKNEKA